MSSYFDFSLAGMSIRNVEEWLHSGGFKAFSTAQRKFNAFATDDETDEHKRYLSEHAAEVLSYRRGGAEHPVFGRAYRSEYIRDIKERFPASNGNLLGKKMDDLVNKTSSDLNDFISSIFIHAKEEFATEAQAMSPAEGDISNTDQIVQSIKHFAQIDGAVCSKKKGISDSVVLHAFSLADDLCIAMAPSGRVSVNARFAIIPWRPYVVCLPASKVVGKHISMIEDHAHGLDIDSAIEGFNIYQISYAISQSAHAARAYAYAAKGIVSLSSLRGAKWDEGIN